MATKEKKWQPKNVIHISDRNVNVFRVETLLLWKHFARVLWILRHFRNGGSKVNRSNISPITLGYHQCGHRRARVQSLRTKLRVPSAPKWNMVKKWSAIKVPKPVHNTFQTTLFMVFGCCQVANSQKGHNPLQAICQPDKCPPLLLLPFCLSTLPSSHKE